MKKQVENYPLDFVIEQNLFLLVYIGIGFIGMFPLQIYGIPIISLFYIVNNNQFFNS